MNRTPRLVLALVGGALLTLSLFSCGGGGGSDGGGTTLPAAIPAQTIVSGTVQAPGGQIAFFKKRNFEDLFTTEAFAALTGLTSVPDNTIVELARLNANVTGSTVITTTTTSGGRYSFNLTSLGLQPAHDLIVRVAGPSGKEMRAFVVDINADLSPVSEAAYQLVVESLGGGPLINLTLQEVSDITGAVGLIAALQNIGNATSIDQAAALVKTGVRANAQVMGFLTAAAIAGQTTQGTGDVGNFYPFEQGNIWRYAGTTAISGPTIAYENTVIVSGQGPAPGYGVTSTIFSETNAEGENRAEKTYGVKGPSGITAYGNDDPEDNITRQLIPYQAVHFPLSLGVTTVLTDRSGLDWGEDVDGDGRNESVSVVLSQTAVGMEQLTVSAGTFSNALRVEQKAVFVVTFTTGGSARLIQTDTDWLVPNVGRVKGLVQAQVEGGPVVGTLSEELLSYIVNGQGGGFRIQVTPTSASTTLGGTQQLTATAFDQTNRPIQDYPFIWTSSNSSVVDVDSTGLVTGLSLGQATISAMAGSISSNPISISVQDIRVMTIETSDLVYDNVRQRIYASVPSNAGTNPNRIIVINPQTATVTQSIVVGDNPGKLAISDNFQYLYVAVNAATVSVRRINLSTGQVDLSFSVGTNIVSGQLRVDDIKVIPGAPQSVVVARKDTGSSPRYAGAAVFDNGIQRPNTSAIGESSNLLEFGAVPSRLYGADRETSGNTLSILNIGSSGIALVDVGCCSFDGRFDTGLIYSKNGQIIDPELKRVVGVLPGISLSDISSDNLIATDPSKERIYLVRDRNGERTLLAFDRRSLLQIGSADLSPPLLTSGSPTSSLILWGSDGLAFRDAWDNKLVLLRTTILQ
jgi:hypothetical protein